LKTAGTLAALVAATLAEDAADADLTEDVEAREVAAALVTGREEETGAVPVAGTVETVPVASESVSTALDVSAGEEPETELEPAAPQSCDCRAVAEATSSGQLDWRQVSAACWNSVLPQRHSTSVIPVHPAAWAAVVLHVITHGEISPVLIGGAAEPVVLWAAA